MPKVFGLRLLPVIVASVVFFFIGFVWYGLLFSDAWMAAHNITAESAAGESQLWMAAGFAITILEVVGLGLVMKWKNALSPQSAAAAAAVLWLCLALPLILYSYIYASHDATLLAIDASHILVGWVASALVLSFMKV
ncbi:MAG: DUF1761 family protein [Alphaproteobacteria bacterium]|nr:DUF1761 family protein [Alphaproteobacteria bacterium]